MKPANCLILALLLCLASPVVGRAQSRSSDRDHPTRLKSNALEGSLNGSGKEYFYSFVAGRGELTLTVDVTSSEGLAALNYELLDGNGFNTLACCEFAQANSSGESGQTITSMTLARKQVIVLRLRLGETGKGTYRVRFSGTAVPKR